MFILTVVSQLGYNPAAVYHPLSSYIVRPNPFVAEDKAAWRFAPVKDINKWRSIVKVKLTFNQRVATLSSH